MQLFYKKNRMKALDSEDRRLSTAVRRVPPKLSTVPDGVEGGVSFWN